MAEPVAFVLKGYPRLSETFIAQEIKALEDCGLSIELYSLRHPTDKETHPIHDEIKARPQYLPEYIYHEPVRVWQAWRKARELPGYQKAKTQWLKDWRRDRTPNRGRRFAQAMVLATELPAHISHIHAHFLHTPASVARYAAFMRGNSWSCSAHAKDIWTIPNWEKQEKLDDLKWLTVCSRAALESMQDVATSQTISKITLNYHGLDLDRFAAPTEPPNQGGPVNILSVGRAVSKKGYSDLLNALALLPADLDWRFIHIGGGSLREVLRRQAIILGISEQIEWRGALPQAEVMAAYREADIFVLASRIGEDGDRDGLPNVLMEAQSQRLAVVATDVSGIPELVLDGETGLLVPQQSPRQLSEALASLIRDPERRARLGTAGDKRVRAHFGHLHLLTGIADQFGLTQSDRSNEVEQALDPDPTRRSA